ncbi:DUF2877 domain-containing protein [Sporomusa termitida]|uniref:DUF2877 domain-containing protein n=1 Tax=Sporomusa termitida TaxID=2377 RepID=A0A517DR44_9FIRM|nr:DUF2877 domain-containing protein [Sporomusa termitida]QDR79842.1 hypothetical protein SPTER_11440 [Sporomusa termitida]
MLRLKAAAISTALVLPADNTIGQIKSLHRDYINIFTAGGMVTLVRSGLDHIPFGLEVDIAGSWLCTGLDQQQKVLYLADAIIIGETLTIQGVQQCPRFSCQYAYYPAAAGNFSLRLQLLQQLYHDTGRPGGMMAYIGEFDAGMMCRAGAIPGLSGEKVPQLIRLLIAGSLEDQEPLLAEGICGLLGLGPGSTPSGDDFLLGFLAGLIHTRPQCCRPAAAKMAQLLVRNAPGLTTLLSVEYLRYGARGWYHQRLGEVIQAFTDGTDREMLDKARKLMQLGHFSGADLLVGFVYGGFTALSAGITVM